MNKNPKQGNWFQRNKILSVILGIILFIIIISSIGGSSSDSESPQNAPEGAETTESESIQETIKISVKALMDEYESNSALADTKYKDQYLEVTGEIEEIEGDSVSSRVNLIAGGDDHWLQHLTCWFSGDQASSVFSLSKGQTMTVTGLFKREDIFDDLEMKRCSLVE